MTHIACGTQLRSVVTSHMHPSQETVAIGRAIVNYARAARSFSTGIKCRHCTVYSYFLGYHIQSVAQWRQLMRKWLVRSALGAAPRIGSENTILENGIGLFCNLSDYVDIPLSCHSKCTTIFFIEERNCVK